MSADALTARFFLDVALIVLVARAMGLLFRRFGQPPVIGEILAGIMLGPTLLGALPGDLTGLLFPPTVRAALQIVGQLALAVFMFTVGWSLDLRVLRRNEHTAATISFISACVPFGLGAALAVALHRTHGIVDGRTVPLLPFALFIGASMSITAFPVLARILVDRRMERGVLGALVLSCAAIDDMLGWTLVVVVLAVLSSAGAWEWARVLVELALFVLVMRALVKPAIAWALRALRGRIPSDGHSTAAALVAGALACAATTQLIGIHFVLGAFAFGLVLPRTAADAEMLARARNAILPLVALLLPVYFVLPGLNVDVGSLTARDAAELAGVLVVACAGKLGGAVAGARIHGVGWRDALAIGALMNTRGLIELVVLTIGYDHGILDRRLFTIMVLMAVATTVLTGPLLHLIYRTAWSRDGDAGDLMPRRAHVSPSTMARSPSRS